MNYYSDEKDWKWLLEHGIEWDKIIPLYYKEFPTPDGIESKEELMEFFHEFLGTLGQWSAESITEMAEKFDREGCGTISKDGKQVPNEVLKRLYREASELGYFSIITPREYEGMELPASLLVITFALISRGYLGATSQLSFFNSMIDMIYRYCPKEVQDKWIPIINAGEASGCMVMTEPEAGSDLAKIKTTATKQEDGSYSLTGVKNFITNAGGGVAFVLAKIKGAPDSLDGLSMFFCEHLNANDTTNFKILKNEEKMGQHGSFTCQTIFENSRGILIGKEGEGFKIMLELMNEARLCTGMQAVGGIESALDHAFKYAQERQQFGKPIAELPLLKRNLEDYFTERDALRALLVATTSDFEVYYRLKLKMIKTGDLTQQEQKLFKDKKNWMRKRTPLVKYYATESFVSLSTKAIQVLGGYGYMQEYPLERIHRDSFGPILYEGTSQIQSLMALKDLMKYIMGNPQKYFSDFILKHPTVKIFSASTEYEKDFLNVQYNFKKKFLALLIKTMRPKNESLLNIASWKSESGLNRLVIHSETLCQALSYVETLRILQQHAIKDKERADLFYRYKRLVSPRLEAIYADWKEERELQET